MSYRRRFSVKMPDYEDEVTVVDVYDLAADIGKECEIIIEKYGADAVTALLPKVINALELLENLAVRTEKENHSLQELTAKISQLENDKIEKAEYRQRFEKEIEAIEEQWRNDSAELVSAVTRLQDENKRLRRTLNSPSDGTSAPPSPAREHDQEVLSRLSSTAEKQRSTLRHQELQLQQKQQMIDSLTNDVEKLAQVSRDLKRKQKQMQNQLRLVCEERTELTAIVQSQQRDIAALQQSDAQNKKCVSCGAGPEQYDEDEQTTRPTFSVRELRAILHERNELKARLSRAEEQINALSQLQQESQPDSNSDTSPPRRHTLRQELLSLPLTEQEVNTWLGQQYDEQIAEDDEISTSDVPLRRSLSLDGGRDVFVYLENLGSQMSLDSAVSMWTVESDVDENILARYASLEDIPASPASVRSRRPSSVADDRSMPPNLALSVMKSSFDLNASSGSLSPQIRKLQKSFSFKNSVEDLKALSNLKDIGNESDDKRLEYRDINMKSESISAAMRPVLHRMSSYQNIKKTASNNMLLRTAIHKSCLELNEKGTSAQNVRFKTDRGKNESAPATGEMVVKSSVAKNVNIVSPNTSKLDDVEECDCQICRETNVDKRTEFTSIFSLLFYKIINNSRRGRLIRFWDENNNVDEGDMWKCIMHILKCMFGLWLRHLDHN